MTTKRAYTLMEVLIVIAVIPVVFLVITKFFTGMIMEIPPSFHLVMENTCVMRMMAQLQEDMDQADNLPQEYGPWIQDANTLLIQWPNNMIRYHRNGDVLVRYESQTFSDPNDRAMQQWTIPHVVMDWQIQRPQDRVTTLTIQTYIKQTLWDKRKKMANSYVFHLKSFAGATLQYE